MSKRRFFLTSNALQRSQSAKSYVPKVDQADNRDQSSANVVPRKASEPRALFVRKAIAKDLHDHPNARQRRGNSGREQSDHDIG